MWLLLVSRNPCFVFVFKWQADAGFSAHPYVHLVGLSFGSKLMMSSCSCANWLCMAMNACVAMCVWLCMCLFVHGYV